MSRRQPTRWSRSSWNHSSRYSIAGPASPICSPSRRRQLLEMLGDGPLDLAAVRERLSKAFDLPDLTDAALAARLDELVAAGLIATA